MEKWKKYLVDGIPRTGFELIDMAKQLYGYGKDLLLTSDAKKVLRDHAHKVETNKS